MKFKLNESAPQQHMAIVVLAGLFIFINTLEAFKAKSRHDEKVNGPTQKFSDSFDPMSGQLVARETKFQNPKLTWYEWIFCRGFQRSSSCSYRLLHPFGNEDESLGASLPDERPKTEHVVYSRGNVERGFSRTVTAPSNVAPPAKIMDSDE